MCFVLYTCSSFETGQVRVSKSFSTHPLCRLRRGYTVSSTFSIAANLVSLVALLLFYHISYE